jgi:hypothetical protein
LTLVNYPLASTRSICGPERSLEAIVKQMLGFFGNTCSATVGTND